MSAASSKPGSVINIELIPSETPDASLVTVAERLDVTEIGPLDLRDFSVT
ncbi:MAG: hypothetical protein M3042_05950 [Actinomycetota bacterium]|nr:hypothetical protein [Actinomycetota bacterium]